MISTPEDGSPLDLHALDPDLRSGAEARFAAAVMATVRGRPIAPLPLDPLFAIWTISRPLLAAACVAAIAIISVRALGPDTRDAPPATVAEATGVPPLFLAHGSSRP